MVLILGAHDMGVIIVWVDVSFATHSDMKSHTGGCMSFGIGAFCCMSSKQRLVTKSSTEGEFVGTSDYLSEPVFAKMFLEGQGIKVKTVIINQDNESTIKLLKNGKASAGRQSRHINLRYWWSKDILERENFTVTYCPTLALLADYLTKPLQGALFRWFRSVLLGHKHIRHLTDYLLTSEERVKDRVWLTADDVT